MYVCVRVSDSPGTGVTDRCELSCGCWELNPGPLEEQSMLLTTEPSLQPIYHYQADLPLSLVLIAVTMDPSGKQASNDCPLLSVFISSFLHLCIAHEPFHFFITSKSPLNISLWRHVCTSCLPNIRCKEDPGDYLPASQVPS